MQSRPATAETKSSSTLPPELLARYNAASGRLLIADDRRLDGLLRRAAGGQPVDLARFGRDLDAASLKAENRLRLKPATIAFPEELPVSQAREEIGRAILDHQVIVLCGETGSGKTTQLPKLCLELGRGTRGLIGHTQPRRLAARSVATRIAQELGSPLGQLVGYETRFDRRVGDTSLVKLMTDGILLAELQRDRELTAYDTIIIDEAHERSLNIDFLLGWLKRLLPRRPDLKLIVTSATLDPERLAKHFENANGPAPILKVEGRTFPVTMRYREPDPDLDLEGQVGNGIDELWAGGGRPGDVLVFLPGEREIRDLARSLPGRFPKAEVLPLYSRLPAEQQDRVFGRGSAPRIVLATNVAETSVTVPGIRYVVDTGTARVNRYSTRLGVQQLQIEGISQAAANQRAGRCGRIGPGTCLRLYTEADFQGRDLFTDPEVLRANLAGVILQMAALGLGDVDDFPWVDAPENRHVSEGYRLLQTLGALDDDRALTKLGRELARLPLDPRIARIVAAGKGQEQDAVCVLAAALSVQDPHEVPPDQQTQARQKHAVWRHARSDFYTLLNLWREWQKWSEGASNRALRKICREQYVSYLRMEEWESVYKQIVDMTRVKPLSPRERGRGEGVPVATKPKLDAQALAFARELRAQSTDAESKLWYLLRDRRLNGLKFRRQHPVGAYTLDFYCDESKLAVELDGGQHNESAQQVHDTERTAFLSSRGINLLRFWNDEFLKQPESVLEAILAAAARPSPGPSGHPLPAGEGKKLADFSPEKLEELYPQIHKALAAGLIDHIGLRLPAEKNERPEFQGPRGRKYRVFPGSTLAKKPPPWLLSAQLSQTSQLFARTNADVLPQWLSEVGAHLVKKTVTHPVWNAERGEVQCTEYHTLFGLQLLKRNCHYGSIDAVDARRIFITEGLVRGLWTAKPRFLTDNLKLIEDVQDKEARMRRPDLLADESQLYAFYDQRIPQDVCTANNLKAWLRTASADKGDPGRILKMKEPDVLRPGANADVEDLFPDLIDIGGHTLQLSYQHEPGEDEDGVSFHIPLSLLYQLPDAPFDYLVPGLRAPRIEALIRSLPMNLRRQCTPAAEYANALSARMQIEEGAENNFLLSMARHFDAMIGVKLKPEDFDTTKLPAHLKPSLVLEDAQGKVLARAESLSALKKGQAEPARAAIAVSAQREDVARRWVRSEVKDWDFGDLPEHVDLANGARAWPALCISPLPPGEGGAQRRVRDSQPQSGSRSASPSPPAPLPPGEGSKISLALFESPDAARAAHLVGVRALLLSKLSDRMRDLVKTAKAKIGLALIAGRYDPEAIARAVAERAAAQTWKLADLRTENAFKDAVQHRGEFGRLAVKLLDDVCAWLLTAAELRRSIRALDNRWPDSIADMNQQLDSLLAPGFIEALPDAQWPRVSVWLKAIATRLQRLPNKPQRDIDMTLPLRKQVAQLPGPFHSARWLIEEWRVAQFAQELKAVGSPSVERINAQLKEPA
ncbi:ATP-dependent RNA helicase HrpA [Hydrocarboniphaga sp.]|uniref:ATP-dependent RNA helicase HrpA n=1 Tax=Hydrocarboniphaga sp. TaxID=2033016 RepID=UPI003D0FD87E